MEESAAQLFPRLGAKQSLGDLSIALFSHLPFGLKPGDVVELVGDEGSAKSEFLLNITANCVLPKSWNDVHIPDGRNVDVIYISTDFKFDILRLANLLECKVRRDCCNQLTTELHSVMEELVTQCMSRVHVLYCQTSAELVAALQSLKTYLRCHPNVCVLILDSIATYYWTDRLQFIGVGVNTTFENKIVKAINDLIAEYHLVVFITKPQLFHRSSTLRSNTVLKATIGDTAVGTGWERMIKYRFELRKCLSDKQAYCYQYEVEQIYPAGGRVHQVAIGQCGVTLS